ncbi:MAG: (2Fe-2S) ferredoxin domain-containing protein [Planctomycetes bacterium]|nr:(2Fe-2S) ferredoxin domain-containing protein [Planctomycetota bacterium]
MSDPKLIYVCEGGDCTERGSGDIHDKLKEMLLAKDPEEAVARVRRYPCFGGCECGINVTVWPDRHFYSEVKEGDLPEIMDAVTGAGAPVARLQGKVKPDVEEMVWTLLDSPY